jgi:hypothetical protein
MKDWRIVNYMAFDRAQSKVFFHSDFEAIHKHLREKCNTYVVLNIMQIIEVDFLALNNLTQFTNESV